MNPSPIKRKTRLRKKSKRSSDTRALDSLCRDLVLARDGHRCRKCGKEAGRGAGHALQSAHILPKGQYPALRWELGNLLTLCVRCHLFWWHRSPLEAAAWVTELLGQKELERLRTIGLARSRTDKKALRLYLQSVLTSS